MARNTERDEREATRRKEQLMKAGFKLFSENGIENVSLQKVADAADVGVATMYKYYQTKVKLVVAISGNCRKSDAFRAACFAESLFGTDNYRNGFV